MLPRRFALVRHVDYTGISGVGVVAYGVVFPDGHVALRWASDYPATSLWNSIDDMLAVHGHGEATSVEWIDPATDPFETGITSSRGRRARRARPDIPTAPPADPPIEAPAAPPVAVSADPPVEVSADPPVEAPAEPSPVPDADVTHDTSSAAGPVTDPAPTGGTSHDAHISRAAEPGRRRQSPSPPPRPPGSESRLPAQRRPGRHRRASAEQESESTLPIESDW